MAGYVVPVERPTGAGAKLSHLTALLSGGDEINGPGVFCCAFNPAVLALAGVITGKPLLMADYYNRLILQTLVVFLKGKLIG